MTFYTFLPIILGILWLVSTVDRGPVDTENFFDIKKGVRISTRTKYEKKKLLI